MGESGHDRARLSLFEDYGFCILIFIFALNRILDYHGCERTTIQRSCKSLRLRQLDLYGAATKLPHQLRDGQFVETAQQDGECGALAQKLFLLITR
jgi:hypothetical protein